MALGWDFERIRNDLLLVVSDVFVLTCMFELQVRGSRHFDHDVCLLDF